MDIGLINIDKTTRFPNLVLMKLSAYHKQKGDNVSIINLEDAEQEIKNYDKVYGACVFTENRTHADRLKDLGVEVGGSGTTEDNKTLPNEIEHMTPDYKMFGVENIAYGFLTRGCPRRCPFCIVSKKEGGQSYKVANLKEFWNGEKEIKLLDPNILAANSYEDLLMQLADSKAAIDFTQGIDARLLTKENIELLNTCKVKMIHFAWDNPKDKLVPRMLDFFAENSNIQNYRKRRVYVLTNYWSTHDEDLYRIYWLRERGYDPYVMVYDKPNAPQETRRLQRWVNNKIIFRTCDRFEDYEPR